MTETLRKAKAKKPNGGKLKEDTFTIDCVHCGKKNLSVKNGNFYRANDKSLFVGLVDNEGTKWIPVCKNCVREKIYLPYLHETKDYYKAVYYTCRKLDILYTQDLAETALSRSKGDTSKAIGYVFGLLGSLQQYSGHLHNFDDSEHIMDEGGFEDKVASIKNGAKIDSNSKRARKDIIKKIGYDPFSNSGLSDYELNFVYNDLVGFLSADDELATDSYKLNIVLQLVNNGQQIRTLDLYLSVLNNSIEGFKDNMAVISTFIEQKRKLVDSNTKIYKENKSWLGASAGNKSKLGALMRRYREYGFHEIETNYFDILTAEATQTVMNLSHESILERINFGSEEEKKIFDTQRSLIKKKDLEIAKIFEEKRELAIELQDLRKKYEGDK